MALVQTAQIAEWLGWSADKVTERQADLTRVAEAASSGVRRMCGRAFEPDNAATRTFSLSGFQTVALVGDVRSVSRVEVRHNPRVAFTEVAAGGYELLPAARRDWPSDQIVRTDGYYFPPGPNGLRVTGDWEFSRVPESIEQATVMLAANLLARAQSPKQVATSFTGTEIDLGSYYDLDIMSLVDDFKVGAGQVA